MTSAEGPVHHDFWSAWWWSFAFLILAGLFLIAAAVSGFLTRPREIMAGGCLYCSSSNSPPYVWTSPILTLLFAGVVLVVIGVFGGLVAKARRRASSRLRAPPASWGWWGFLTGATGWTLGAGFLTLLQIDGSRQILPNGSGLPILLGGLVLLVLSSLVWSRVLRRSPSGVTVPAANVG